MNVEKDRKEIALDEGGDDTAEFWGGMGNWKLPSPAGWHAKIYMAENRSVNIATLLGLGLVWCGWDTELYILPFTSCQKITYFGWHQVGDVSTSWESCFEV